MRAVALPDGTGILLAGGFTYPFTNTSYKSQSLIFDGKSWTPTKGSLPWARSNMGLVVAPKSGAIFAVGGSATNPAYDGVAKYDASECC